MKMKKFFNFKRNCFHFTLKQTDSKTEKLIYPLPLCSIRPQDWVYLDPNDVINNISTALLHMI